MSRSSQVHIRLGVALVALMACLTGINAAAAPVAPQALPSPFRFVSFLDLECFVTNAYQPPLATPIVVSHLNPVLAGLPTESHVLGVRSQLCTPVAKNNVVPPNDVLPFVRFVDLACYRITGQAVNFPLVLRHLNPLLANQPPKNTAIGVPEQLCLPVIKNGVLPPAEVLDLVRYIDLKCYRVANQNPLNVGLQLTQLNPVFGGIPPVQVGVTNSRQLCVPVRKNTQAIPAATLNIVRWVDLEKYDIAPPHQLAASMTVKLRHINPLLTGLPEELATFNVGTQLMLPVQKNNAIPPS